MTLLAPLALLLLPRVALPGVNIAVLADQAQRDLFASRFDPRPFSVIALGLTPVLAAYLVVELVALAVPRLRWRRHDPGGRIGLGRAVAAIAVVLALLHGWVAASYIEALSHGGNEVVAAPGAWFHVVVAVSLLAGTMLLTAIARVIREHGLGNGYSALIAFDGVLTLARVVTSESLGGTGLVAIVMLAGFAAIAAATWYILRQPIGGGSERSVALRVPTSGIHALNPLGGTGYVVAAVLGSGVAWPQSDWVQRIADVGDRAWVMVVSVCLFVPLWSWLFARPSLVKSIAERSGLEPPSRAAWLRATWLTLVVMICVALAALAIAWPRSFRPSWALGAATYVMFAAATVLDIIGDARARRAELAPVWVVHQIQYLGVIGRILGDADIPCHVHASHVRTLLAFFGPWAPAIVLVPASSASEARAKLDSALREPAGPLPAMRVHAGGRPSWEPSSPSHIV